MDALILRNLQHDLNILLEDKVLALSIDDDDTNDLINVSFIAPDSNFVSSLSGDSPTVNCYLIGIDEDKKRRQSEPARKLVSSDEKTVSRFYDPRFVDVTYMLTVWSLDTEHSAEIEHLLLGCLINGLGRYDFFPIAEVQEIATAAGTTAKLTEALYGIRMILFGSQYADKVSGQVWQAMASTPKPCLMLSFSVPVDVRESTTHIVLGEFPTVSENTNSSSE